MHLPGDIEGADGEFITRWNVRPFATGNGVAAIGAECSDGSMLTPVPSNKPSTVAWGDAYYFNNASQGWVDMEAL